MSFTIGIGIILLLMGAALFIVWRFKKDQSQKQIMHLKELFWSRRARMPLLIEILKQHQVEPVISKKLITTRNELSQMRGAIAQEIELEQQYTKMIEEIIHQAKSHVLLKSEVVFLALSKELTEIGVDINGELHHVRRI